MAAPNSILNSVKKALYILPDDTSFDDDLIMHINSVFMILNQLGVGPDTVFSITDKDTAWQSFMSNIDQYSLVKTYVIEKVKQFFDPPQAGPVMAALERVLTEMESRLLTQMESYTPA